MRIIVHGNPAPQGSKRHVGNGVMVESSKAVKPWREAVKWAALELHLSAPIQDAVTLDITFVLPRPKSLPKKVLYHTKRPDLDKLLRSTLDALKQAGVYGDDSQVCKLIARKMYQHQHPLGIPGAVIDVERGAEAA